MAELWKDLGRLLGIPEGVHRSLREPKCVLVSLGSLPPRLSWVSEVLCSLFL